MAFCVQYSAGQVKSEVCSKGTQRCILAEVQKLSIRQSAQVQKSVDLRSYTV